MSLLDKVPAPKLPFPIDLMDSEPVEVTNPFSGAKCMLTPTQVSVYDVIRGAEMLGAYSIVRKGLDWFRKHYAEEYYILLD